MSKIWFLHDSQRLAVEREAILALEEIAVWLTGTDWVLDGTKLCIDAVICAHGYHYQVKLVYPTLFPAVPPTIYPKISDEDWSSHQYQSGALCLEWRPDTWHPNVTGAQVLESAYNLLHIENPLGIGDHRVAPSQHGLSIGQALRNSYGRFYAHNELIAYLSKLPSSARGWLEFSVRWQSKSFLVLIQHVQPDKLPAWEDKSIPPGMRGSTENRTIKLAAFFTTELDPETISKIDSWQELETALHQAGYESDVLTGEHSVWATKPEEFLFGVLLTDTTNKLHFFIQLNRSREDKVWQLAPVHSGVYKVNTRIPTDLHALVGKSVSIIGLGSAGSKIALSLARTGIGDFKLADEDIFLPDNVCRNELDWRNVGEHKVNAIAEILSYIAPQIKVEVSTINLAGQESRAARQK